MLRTCPPGYNLISFWYTVIFLSIAIHAKQSTIDKPKYIVEYMKPILSCLYTLKINVTIARFNERILANNFTIVISLSHIIWHLLLVWIFRIYLILRGSGNDVNLRKSGVPILTFTWVWFKVGVFGVYFCWFVLFWLLF